MPSSHSGSSCWRPKTLPLEKAQKISRNTPAVAAAPQSLLAPVTRIGASGGPCDPEGAHGREAPAGGILMRASGLGFNGVRFWGIVRSWYKYKPLLFSSDILNGFTRCQKL